MSRFNIKPQASFVYPNSPSPSTKNLLLVDRSVKGAGVFVDSVNSNTFPVTYSKWGTKAELLSILKKNYIDGGISRIGIVFYLENGSPLFLEGKPFFHNDNVEFIVSIIKEFGVKNIDYLACETLGDSLDWKNYYENLESKTGVIVGASSDKTGNIKYGGDWVMENTSEDVEFVYFTKNIEYYKYLLDNPNWATGLNSPACMAINGSFMYVSNFSNGTAITQLNLADGTIVNPDWSPELTYYAIGNNYVPFAIIIYGSFVYVTCLTAMAFGGIIVKLNLSDGSISSAPWCTALNFPTGMIISGSYLYVCNYISGNIAQVNLSDGSFANSLWATGLDGPIGLAINGSYMYVSNYGAVSGGNTISQINLSNGSIANIAWSSGLNAPFFIVINGSYMYASSGFNSTIMTINLADGTIANLNWKTDLAGPIGLIVYGKYLYVTCIGNGTIAQLDLLPPNANICFLSTTPICTDQGIMKISEIDPNTHTIGGHRIVDITKTICSDKYLVYFDKNALGENCPSNPTVISRNHKICYKNKMIEARKFIGRCDKVYKFKYNGEVLYNILMEKQYCIIVNNIICETLHPDNVISKLYSRSAKYNETDRNKIVFVLNDCLKKGNYTKYMKIKNSL